MVSGEEGKTDKSKDDKKEGSDDKSEEKVQNLCL